MTYYKKGVWNCLCDVCGFQFKSSDLRKRWDGFMVCDADWEMRHPLDLIKIARESPSPPWTRSEPDDGFETLAASCTLDNSVAKAEVAVAGCAVASRYNKWGEWI